MRKGLLIICLLLPSLTLATPKPVYKMTTVNHPTARLTGNWAFVFDTSHSMQQERVEQAHYAFLSATNHAGSGVDDWKFCVFTFNDHGVDRFLGWQEASVDAFKAAHKWSNKKRQRGVLSYANNAIKKALRLKKGDLTIILITDGGFSRDTSGIDGMVKVKQIIAEGQTWRQKHGYGKAIITCIGIQNLYYRTGYKKPDPICQRGLQEIGTANAGGYFYVHQGQFHTSLISPPPAKLTVLQKVKSTIKRAFTELKLKKVKASR